MEKTRNPVFDVMKGICIILMLIGHIPPREEVYHFIYSFHMPLFFILAGVFAKTSTQSEGRNSNSLKKDVKRLILPVLVTQLFILFLSPLHYYEEGGFSYSKRQILSMLWNGDVINTKYGDLGSQMWFLFALFWTRTFFRSLEHVCLRCSKWHDEIIVAVCAFLSVSAVVLHNYFSVKLPWEIMRGTTALVFYATGWYLNKHKQPVCFYLTAVAVWLAALWFGGIEMYQYYYGCYPIDVIGTIGAIWLVYHLSRLICEYAPRSGKLLQWFGVNSLIIYCIHSLDRHTYLVKTIRYISGIHLTGSFSVLMHYGITLFMVAIMLYIPFFKRLYGAKKLKEI